LSTDLPAARQLARRLIERGGVKAEATPDTALLAATALDRLYVDLALWVGFDGCHTLFTRALAEARSQYPLLQTVHLHARSVPYVEGVADTMEKNGRRETAEALESMLVMLIELLNRLIGENMATILIERGFAGSEGDDPGGKNRRAEA
jgi:hypothetical protein